MRRKPEVLVDLRGLAEASVKHPGAAAGAILGGLLGAALASSGARAQPEDVAATAILGAGLGALLGAGIEAASGPRAPTMPTDYLFGLSTVESSPGTAGATTNRLRLLAP